METAAQEKVGDSASLLPAVPPRAAPGSAWPGALRIDVELAENHARMMAPAVQVRSGVRSLESRRENSSTGTLSVVENDLRRNNRAEIANRRDGDDDDDAGTKVESGAESRICQESLPFRRVTRRGGGCEKSKSGGIATRSAGQRKQQQERRSVLLSKIQPNPVGCWVGGEDMGSDPDGRMSTTSDETRKGEGSLPSKSNSGHDGGSAVVYPAVKTASKNYCLRACNAACAAGTAAAAPVSSEISEQHADIGSKDLGRVEDGRGDEKTRVDRGSVNLLNKGKDGGNAQICCRLASPIDLDAEQEQERPPPQAPVPMGQVAVLLSQVGIGMQIVVAATSAASKGLGYDYVRGIITAADPEAPPLSATRRTRESSVTVDGAAPRPLQRKSSSPTFRETNATSLDLRRRCVEIKGRCQSSIKSLQAASVSIAGPGENLRRSFEAYCRAHRSLYEIENSVRCAEEHEAITICEFRRASEAAVATHMELARARMALRYTNDIDSISPYPSPCLSSLSLSETISNNSSKECDRDVDDNKKGEASSARPASSSAGATAAAEGEKEEVPRQTKRNKTTEAQNEANSENGKAAKPARLALAFETARDAAERASADKCRAEAEVDSALILVGALTAGDWTLAFEACDAARATYEKVADETIPKLQEFKEEVRVFQHLSKLMIDARQKLDSSRQAWEAANRGGGSSGAGCDEQDVHTGGDGNGSGVH